MGIFHRKICRRPASNILPFLVPLLAKNAPNIVELAIVCFTPFWLWFCKDFCISAIASASFQWGVARQIFRAAQAANITIA